jgi:hypothetical protein
MVSVNMRVNVRMVERADGQCQSPGIVERPTSGWGGRASGAPLSPDCDAALIIDHMCPSESEGIVDGVIIFTCSATDRWLALVDAPHAHPRTLRTIIIYTIIIIILVTFAWSGP